MAQLCRGAGEGDPSLVPTNETCPPLSSFQLSGTRRNCERSAGGGHNELTHVRRGSRSRA